MTAAAPALVSRRRREKFAYRNRYLWPDHGEFSRPHCSKSPPGGICDRGNSTAKPRPSALFWKEAGLGAQSLARGMYWAGIPATPTPLIRNVAAPSAVPRLSAMSRQLPANAPWLPFRVHAASNTHWRPVSADTCPEPIGPPTKQRGRSMLDAARAWKQIIPLLVNAAISPIRGPHLWLGQKKVKARSAGPCCSSGDLPCGRDR